MSSSGGKGDGEDNAPQLKNHGGGASHKKRDKAEHVKKYYKKKYDASKQQERTSSPKAGQNAAVVNSTSTTPQNWRASGTPSGGATSYSSDRARRRNTGSPNWQSYDQLKNHGRKDLSDTFEENCNMGEKVEDRRQKDQRPGSDRKGQRETKASFVKDTNRLDSPRQRQGQGGNASSPNRPYTPKGKGGASSKRAKCFEDYWKKEDVQAGLKRGQLVEGPVRINPNNYEEAYVAHPDGQADIYMRGLSTRNRALNGDWVAVLLEPRDNWKVNIPKMEESAAVFTELVKKCQNSSSIENPDVVVEEEYEEETGHVAAQNPEDTGSGPPDITKQNPTKTAVTEESNTLGSGSSAGAKKTDQGLGNESATGGTPRKQGKNADVPNATTPKRNKGYTALKDLGTQNSGSSRLEILFSPSKVADNLKVLHESIPDEYLQRTGKVVYITDKKHSRACTGHLRPSGRPNFAKFSPTDHRVPRINIPVKDWPEGFQERPEDHARTLYVARITDWNDDQMMPLGTLARSLGEAGEIEPETEGILLSYDVDSGEFPQKCLDCLPDVSAAKPWSIPQSELSSRRDFRQECVFTIDPPTARDLDDALHVNDLGNDVYEVGVHIADVSYFVDHDTALDSVAASRATSVYLVQKVIPMLPRLLCEQLCSLNPDEDRLTFSVMWKITGQGEILEEWFGRSVIRSCVKLGYNHAQGFLDEPERDWAQAELPPISAGYEPEVIKQKVLTLNKIAKALRKKRYDGGALSLSQVKMQFTLDKETGMPCGYSVYQQKDSNRLIEEFMLLANMAVAHKIYTSFPEVAVLRRHPPPQQKMVDELQELLNNLGMPVNCTSAKTIQESLLQYTGGNSQSESRSHILTALCAKAMQLAKYFCTGTFDDDEKYRHYALSVPLYTHFTSPIRRYPDIMVHRALAAALEYKELPSLSKEELQKQCTHCNDKKIAAKSVQDLSNNLYFAAFVKECGPLEERGMVMGLSEKSFDVLLLNLGVVKRVFVERLNVESAKYRVNHKKPEMLLVWKSDSEPPTEHRQKLEIFSPVKCVVIADEEPLKLNCLLKHPDDPLVSTQLPDRNPEATCSSAIVVNYEDV